MKDKVKVNKTYSFRFPPEIWKEALVSYVMETGVLEGEDLHYFDSELWVLDADFNTETDTLILNSREDPNGKP